jgi:hypothetical protein
MTSAKRILVLGTSAGGGDWPPLAAVTVGLHQAGHTVQCFGDPAIAQDFASAGIAVEVVPAEEPLGPFMARWQSTGAAGPRASRVWADACLPAVCALVRAFRPQLVLSQLFTMELAGRTKAACGLRWCFINPAYYFGPDSLRPFEVDLAAPWGPKQELRRAIGEADLVLHATDELFDPPPSSLPPHHRYVGPLMWERASEAPPYLDPEFGTPVPGGANTPGTYRPSDLDGFRRPHRSHPLGRASTQRDGSCPCQCPDRAVCPPFSGAYTQPSPREPRRAWRRDESPLLRRAHGPDPLEQ